MKPNKLSKTAAFIAIKFYGLTLTDPYRSLFEKEVVQFYSDLVRHLPFPLKSFHSVLLSERLRSSFMSLEERALPGDLMHILMRKYCIGRIVENLLRDDCRQLVVLGAGFDHMATYYSGRGVQSVELDAPRMADLKTSFVQQYRYNNEHLTIVPAYFSRDRLSVTLGILTDIDPAQKTVVVAEGFFDYFSPDQTEQILEDLSGFFTGEVNLVSTVFSLEELSRFRSSVFRTAVWMAGEQLRLHHSLAEFTSVLKQHDFIVNKHVPASMMETKYLWPRDIFLPVLPGFHLLQARYKRCSRPANRL